MIGVVYSSSFNDLIRENILSTGATRYDAGAEKSTVKPAEKITFLANCVLWLEQLSRSRICESLQLG
jgi:hypothetical protein